MWWVNTAKVQIFWEVGKICKKNVPSYLTSLCNFVSAWEFFFQKFSGVLRISELYVVWFMVNPLLNFAAGRRGGGDGSATQRWNEFFFQAKKALHFKSRVLAWKTGCREVRLSWLRNCSNRGWEQSYTYQVL